MKTNAEKLKNPWHLFKRTPKNKHNVSPDVYELSIAFLKFSHLKKPYLEKTQLTLPDILFDTPQFQLFFARRCAA